MQEIKQPKRREALAENSEKARVSKQLVTLHCDMEVEVPLADTRLFDLDAKRLLAFSKALHLTALTKRIADLYGADPGQVEADPELSRPWSQETGTWADGEPAAREPKHADRYKDGTFVPPGTTPPDSGAPEAPPPMTPAALVAARQEAAAAVASDPTRFSTIATLEELDRWVEAASLQGVVAVDLVLATPNLMSADIVGVALALEPGRAGYLPLAHRTHDPEASEGGETLFVSGLAAGQPDGRAALARLKGLLEDPACLKVGQNLKADWLVLKRHGILMAPLDDTMLLSYALDVGRAGLAPHGTAQLARHYLDLDTREIAELIGRGRKAIPFEAVPIDRATAYAAEEADRAIRLHRLLRPRIVAERRTALYETLERPMVQTLGRMEERGIAIDTAVLSRMSGEFAQVIARVEDEVFEIAGEKFTIGSPKQLADILFGKFGLPGARKTATGQWSTGARLLEDLADSSDHPLPTKVLEWRQLTKLKTYTDTLPTYVNPETGRVHTSYSLASTTTGRLSSTDPNLQNIPIRTQEGRKIRTAFVPTEGHKLVSADYSQIELRLLAHIADIPQLKAAFAAGTDIHATTASEMFGVPVDGMPAEIRRRAKAINFGIVYGISAFGLANQLGIPQGEARDYIARYFERFPGIKTYMSETRRFCREAGYVRTLFGRVCNYPDISNPNPSVRAAVERQAINAPIQGSAADIIRRAMIRMDAALADARLSAKMLLQVHDELVFEVPDEEVEATLPVVTRVMEDSSHPAVQLSVPLAVEARAGVNWDAAH